LLSTAEALELANQQLEQKTAEAADLTEKIDTDYVKRTAFDQLVTRFHRLRQACGEDVQLEFSEALPGDQRSKREFLKVDAG
jgi:hypothetical protein